MGISIKKHRPQHRCYKCGDPKSTCLCCKCYEGICSTHRPDFKSNFLTRTLNWIANRFFKNRVWQERQNFCQPCNLDLKKERSWVEAPFPLLMILSFLVTIWFLNDDQFYKWVVGIFILTILLWGGRMLWKWVKWVNTLPTILSPPKIELLKAAETLTGKFVFSEEGKGEKTVISALGKLNINTRFTDVHQKEIKAYIRKYWYRSKKNFSIRVGYALMKGTALIKNDSTLFASDLHYVIPLTDELKNQTFLAGGDKIDQPKWNMGFSYVIEKAGLPVFILPSFPKGMGQNALKLSLFIQTPIEAGDPGSLEVLIPNQYGIIDECIPAVFTIDRSNPDVQKLTWFKPYGGLEKPAKDLFFFLIRFEKSILDGLTPEMDGWDQVKPITGKVGLALKGPVSGVKEVVLFNGAGGLMDDVPAFGAGTSVTCEFEVSLKSLRYGEKKKILPIPTAGSSPNHFLTQILEDVVPDADTIIRLTNALESNGFYIKQIIEASNLGDQSDEYLRYWTIYGRKYEHLYPVSFQMVVNGREIDNGYVEASSGNANLSLQVDGLYAGEEMEKVIYGVWQDLLKITQTVLKN